MTLEKANAFGMAVLGSYMIDLFAIEIMLIIIRILVFPDIEKKVKQRNAPVIYNLLYFLLSVGTTGSRGGFF
jgi:hypothetical protein